MLWRINVVQLDMLSRPPMIKAIKLDNIGQWSEAKLDIIQAYAGQYANIMNGRQFNTHYIDAFCGAGIHISKDTQSPIMGSPLRVLGLSKPFKNYYFIDQNKTKLEHLRGLCRKHFPEQTGATHFKTENCNQVLADLLPRLRYDKYDRMLCFLDPYGLNLQWDIIRMLGKSRIADVVLNFPLLAANRNILLKKGIAYGRDQRLTTFWGDDSWQNAAYQTQGAFPFRKDAQSKRPESTHAIADAFRIRLKEVAGFDYVINPLLFRNDTGGPLYHLFFATQKEVANNIADHIFRKYGSAQ